MLYLSLLPTLVVLIAAHRAARPAPQPVRWGRFLVVGACVLIVPGGCFAFSLVAMGVFALLIPALFAWSLVRKRVPKFWPFSVTAVLIAYGAVSWSALHQHERYAALRAKYPLESMAERVPEPSLSLRAPAGGSALDVQRLEKALDSERLQFPNYQLEYLHERTVGAFVNSPGFGVIRTAWWVDEETLRKRVERTGPPEQPGSPALWHRGERFEPTSSADREAFAGLHAGGVLDFVSPKGWGYVKSRDRVAGFLSHQFSKMPDARPWQMRRVELVGLLKHPEPVVYLSDRLPAMDELRDAPTRPLDEFERAGLNAVRNGEEVFAARRGDVVRFVGAVRSARQCVACHGGGRGDLLGAFSYTLQAPETGR